MRVVRPRVRLLSAFPGPLDEYIVSVTVMPRQAKQVHPRQVSETRFPQVECWPTMSGHPVSQSFVRETPECACHAHSLESWRPARRPGRRQQGEKAPPLDTPSSPGRPASSAGRAPSRYPDIMDDSTRNGHFAYLRQPPPCSGGLPGLAERLQQERPFPRSGAVRWSVSCARGTLKVTCYVWCYPDGMDGSRLSVAEAARVVGRSPETVRRAVRLCELRATRFGQRGWYEIDEADLRAFVVRSGGDAGGVAGSGNRAVCGR